MAARSVAVVLGTASSQYGRIFMALEVGSPYLDQELAAVGPPGRMPLLLLLARDDHALIREAFDYAGHAITTLVRAYGGAPAACASMLRALERSLGPERSVLAEACSLGHMDPDASGGTGAE
jgi:hypothetical protein